MYQLIDRRARWRVVTLLLGLAVTGVTAMGVIATSDASGQDRSTGAVATGSRSSATVAPSGFELSPSGGVTVSPSLEASTEAPAPPNQPAGTQAPAAAPAQSTTPELVGSVSAIMDPGDRLAHVHTLPTGVRPDDLILATIELYTAIPFTVPSGFTHVATSTGGDGYQPRTVMFYQWANGGETTVTIPFEAYESKSSTVAVYRSVHRQAPIADVATSFNDGDPAISVGGVTAVASSRLVMVVGACSNDTPSSWTGTPAGMIRRAAVESDPWRGMVFYDQAVGAGSTGPRTAVRGLPTHQSAILVDLRPA